MLGKPAHTARGIIPQTTAADNRVRKAFMVETGKKLKLRELRLPQRLHLENDLSLKLDGCQGQAAPRQGLSVFQIGESQRSVPQAELTLGLRRGSAPGTRAYNGFLPIMKNRKALGVSRLGRFSSLFAKPPGR